MTTDNLANLLDALSETSVYVIEEKTHSLLYFNQRCRETGRGRAVLGAKCHTVWPEVCANCPLEALGPDDKASHIVCYDPLLMTTVDVTADRIRWDGHVPAIVVTATPHRLHLQEEKDVRKIEEMYAQSLLTVFDECIIANLTADHYVNCQKDVMWTDIPERGEFGAENRKYAQKVVHPDDLAAFNDHFSREAMLRLFGQGKRKITKRLRRLTMEGVYHMVEFTAALIDPAAENERWCVLVFRDVQDEYLMEKQRSMEITQLATAAQTAYQMLISVNLTQNTYHMLEYERYPVRKPLDKGRFDDLIAAEYGTVHPEYQQEFIGKFSRQALIDAYTNGRRIVSMEVPHRGTDGVYHWHFTQVVRVESPYTDDMMEITLSRNIDEERRMQREALEKERRAKALLEEALQKAEQASQAKSDFLSKMSHDIRTPMNAITGMTELAQLHIADQAKLRDYLDKIASSSAHLLGLINEVLDVSKIESGSVELSETAFDLNALIQESVEIVRLAFEHKQQALNVKLEPGLCAQVKGDEQRIKQVLVNILENASKYSGEKGHVSLSLAEVNRQGSVGTYRFAIEDDGIGMTPAFVQHIFEPFSRADDSRISKVPGTGLGMTIVKNLVSMMGGELAVESEYGKGSRFTVTLYLTQDESAVAKTTPAAPDRTAASFKGMRVLLAEDNEINSQIAVEMLAVLGVQVERAENGQQAVQAICSHPPLYYDLVFMDIRMPQLDGYEATRAIRASGMERIEELPIIAMTADAFAEDIKRAQLAGMNGHLAKPISIDQLKSVLLEYWDAKEKNSQALASKAGPTGMGVEKR